MIYIIKECLYKCIKANKSKIMENKYSRGKVYKVVNNVDDEIYVGSTVLTLSKRLDAHRQGSKVPARQNIALYKKMIEIGQHHFSIYLLVDCPCDSREQLLRKEREYVELLKPTLNMTMPGRSDQEGMKLYYQKNKDELKARAKEYHENNKDYILQRNNQKMQCTCGHTYTHGNKSTHLKTAYHKKHSYIEIDES